jgi:hypothetical protein
MMGRRLQRFSINAEPLLANSPSEASDTTLGFVVKWDKCHWTPPFVTY